MEMLKKLFLVAGLIVSAAGLNAMNNKVPKLSLPAIKVVTEDETTPKNQVNTEEKILQNPPASPVKHQNLQRPVVNLTGLSTNN